MRGVTRREFLAILAAGTAGTGVSRAQEPGGMASRGVRPQPRGKPSGLPFHAHFTLRLLTLSGLSLLVCDAVRP